MLYSLAACKLSCNTKAAIFTPTDLTPEPTFIKSVMNMHHIGTNGKLGNCEP